MRFARQRLDSYLGDFVMVRLKNSVFPEKVFSKHFLFLQLREVSNKVVEFLSSA